MTHETGKLGKEREKLVQKEGDEKGDNWEDVNEWRTRSRQISPRFSPHGSPQQTMSLQCLSRP
jgi:hypothetical protein